MKRFILFLTLTALCFSLSGCGKQTAKKIQEEEIIEILIQGSWYSEDRYQAIVINDSCTIRYTDFTITFFEDGSFRGGCTETKVDKFGSAKRNGNPQYTNSWSIEGNVITIMDGNTPVEYIFSDDYILYGPEEEGYCYIKR